MKKVLLIGLFASLLAVSSTLSASATGFNKIKSLTPLAIGPDHPLEDLMEVEPNDTLEKATVLPHYQLMGAQFLTKDDIDFFKVTIDKDDEEFVLFGLTHPEGQIELDFGLADANGEIVDPYDYVIDGQITAFTYELSAGTYYAWAMESEGLAYEGEKDFYALIASSSDQTAPHLPEVNQVDDNDRKITGKTEGRAKVVVKSGSKVLASGYANPAGMFTLPLKTVLKAGTTLSVTAADGYNNISAAKKVVVKDVTKPAPPKVNKVAPKDKKVTGSAEANAKITVKSGGKVIATGRANSKGKFYVTIKAQKKYTVMYVQAADKANNVSRATRLTVK